MTAEPLLLHANGNHSRLEPFTSRLQLLMHHDQDENTKTRRGRLSKAVADHPVLLNTKPKSPSPNKPAKTSASPTPSFTTFDTRNSPLQKGETPGPGTYDIDKVALAVLCRATSNKPIAEGKGESGEEVRPIPSQSWRHQQESVPSVQRPLLPRLLPHLPPPWSLLHSL